MCTQASILYNDIIILADLEVDKIQNKTKISFPGTGHTNTGGSTFELPLGSVAKDGELLGVIILSMYNVLRKR